MTALINKLLNRPKPIIRKHTFTHRLDALVFASRLASAPMLYGMAEVEEHRTGYIVRYEIKA